MKCGVNRYWNRMPNEYVFSSDQNELIGTLPAKIISKILQQTDLKKKNQQYLSLIHVTFLYIAAL